MLAQQRPTGDQLSHLLGNMGVNPNRTNINTNRTSDDILSSRHLQSADCAGTSYYDPVPVEPYQSSIESSRLQTDSSLPPPLPPRDYNKESTPEQVDLHHTVIVM